MINILVCRSHTTGHELMVHLYIQYVLGVHLDLHLA